MLFFQSSGVQCMCPSDVLKTPKSIFWSHIPSTPILMHEQQRHAPSVSLAECCSESAVLFVGLQGHSCSDNASVDSSATVEGH
ncbi:hypothetical protein AVEN_29217-1 [Araneus ventricosus]|uniref:Uncharacterized protein n=1 Tax=Araneus ventricosus TaxID=182803 RepID=A0A4Y2DY22_ARAVE|nr:hypothetical protein AVEN_29217-1 [Araneus ventricosus]